MFLKNKIILNAIIIAVIGSFIITGIFIWQKINSQQIMVDNSVPTDWIKYHNEQYGFSFWYPKDWNILTRNINNDDNPLLVTVDKLNNKKQITGTFSINYYASITELPENKNYHADAKNLTEYFDKATLAKKIGNIIINGTSYTTATWGDNISTYGVYIPKDSQIFVLSVGTSKEWSRLTNEEKQILQSFKFD